MIRFLYTVDSLWDPPSALPSDGISLHSAELAYLPPTTSIDSVTTKDLLTAPWGKWGLPEWSFTHTPLMNMSGLWYTFDSYRECACADGKEAKIQSRKKKPGKYHKLVRYNAFQALILCNEKVCKLVIRVGLSIVSKFRCSG